MPRTEAEVVQGGPGSDAAAQASAASGAAAVVAPETVVITLNGAQYTVPKALAAGIEQERDKAGTEYGQRVAAQYQTRHAQDSARIAELEEEEPAPGNELKPPSPQDLIDNPEKYHADNKAWTEHLVTSQVAQVDEKHTNAANARDRETAMAADWKEAVTKFYVEYPHLADDKDIVDTVWRANFQLIGSMTPEAGFKKLADLSSTRIAKIVERGKAGKAPKLETSGGAAVKVDKGAEDEVTEPERGGISKAIKERQRRFRNPNFREAAA